DVYIVMGVSYYNNFLFNGSMQLHVAGKYYHTLGRCKATCSVHTIIIFFLMVVCSSMLLESIIILLGAAKQHVRFIILSLGFLTNQAFYSFL
ncbi:MAG: hypothetical protein PHS48_01170, partial [Bacteroidales bacterium]|nr:hypothetical protein [Bacteroidales bacterium]